MHNVRILPETYKLAKKKAKEEIRTVQAQINTDLQKLYKGKK